MRKVQKELKKTGKISTKPKQTSMLEEGKKPARIRLFGGSRLKGHPKTARPLSTKESIHLVLRSARAFGSQSMLHGHNAKKIHELIYNQAECCGIKVYHFVNVGNHLHLVIKLHDIKLYRKFIRAITGLIARQVLKKERGLAKNTSTNESVPNESVSKIDNRFWVARPFTRLIAWGRDYNHVSWYMKKNMSQATSALKTAFKAWGFEITDPKMISSLNSC